MFVNLLPRLATLLGQPATQVIAAGLLTGVVGGSVAVAAGVIPVDGATGAGMTALLACPGSGPVVTSLTPGTDVLVTARSRDGRWLEIFVGRPGVPRGWAPASVLQLEGAAAELPVGDCAVPATPGPTPPPSAPPSAVPSESAPASDGPSPSPSPAPSASPKPSATTAPTLEPTPEPTPSLGPDLSELTLLDVPESSTEPGTYPVYPESCDPYSYSYWTSAPFTVVVTDPDGVDSVTLYYQPLGGSVYSTPMKSEGGSLYNGIFDMSSDWSFGEIDYWVKAIDGVGYESAELHGDASQKLVLTSCGG